MLFLKVPKKQAEAVRQKLIAADNYARGYRAFSEGDFVFIPITKKPRGRYATVELEKEEKTKPRDLRSALEGVLSKENIDKVVTSFDIIGDIAIIEVPEGMEKYEPAIAQGIMQVHPVVQVVAKKLGGMEGEFRVRPLKVIAGENRTETIYKEHGCKFKLDVAAVYFSIRLSTERKRIADLAKPGEKILALFAGVGPFPIVLAKQQPTAEIIAVELNPAATEYMRQNVLLNKLKNVVVEQGDAREIVMKKYRKYADRILMTLPKSADKFLDVAFAGARDGCVVHIYHFAPVENPYEDIEKRIAEEAEKAGAKAEIINKKIVRPYAPKIVQVVVDFRVVK
ncbi:MAG: class I SAM-dependent methyltransferase family protein [Candidatus Micrarchaeota archaeon]